MTSIAIVGAGLGGLIAAQTLLHHGAQVTIFDKGSFPGGRLATRRAYSSPITYDHGAQYFTVKHDRFEQIVHTWMEAGVVAPWLAKLVSFDIAQQPSPTSSSITRHVGTPHMNSVAQHLAEDLNLELRTRVAHITRKGDRFHLQAESGELGDFDAVLLNMPPTQASELLEGLQATELVEACTQHTMHPCWAVMFEHDEPLATFDGAFINLDDSPLSWISRNSSKPGRRSAPPYTWVLHASHAWSTQHLEASKEEVANALYKALCDVLPEPPMTQPTSIQAHRWRYAIPEETTMIRGAAIATSHPLALCGDWLGGGRVEGACLAGLDAAHKLIARLSISPEEHRIKAWQRRPPAPLW